MHLRLRPLLFAFVVLASLHLTDGRHPDAYPVDHPKCWGFLYVQWVLSPQNPTFFYNGSEYPGQAKIHLEAMEKRCGPWPIHYPASDIQARIAGWCVPLFILIGSFQYAALGVRNALFITLHLLSDPCTAIFCLLTKLADDRARHETCRGNLGRPDHECRSVAAILSAYDEWEDCMKAADNVPLDDHNLPGDSAYNVLAQLLAPPQGVQDTAPSFTDELMGACMAAAKELVDSRADGLWKTSLGVLNYIAVCILAFLRTMVGEVNNRTGHTIAFAMLYTFLIPGVLMSAMVGEFVTKRSSKRILIRLQKQFESIGRKHKHPITTVFRFNSVPESELYQMLESVGGNYAFRPHRRCQGREMVVLRIVAAVPVLIATICAVVISYTSPTRGVGCRSVLQLLFFAIWIISAILTSSFSRMIKRPTTLWAWVRVKNVAIFIPQCAVYLAAFCGILNCPRCWSAHFSRGSEAFVLLDMKPEIKLLVRKTWPLLAGSVLVAQLLLVAVAAWVYRRGRLYRMLGNDLE